jgi:hypothetical protein
MSDTVGLLDAMLAVQAEAPPIKKDATNPAFRSKYAALDTIVQTIGPLLAKNGLVWSTMPSFDETTGEPTLRYELAHAPSGQSKDGEMKLLLSKGDPQGQGSAITYARRYALVSVLNLIAGDDDDGHAASQGRYGSAPAKPAAKPAPQRHPELRALFRKHKVRAGEIRSMVRGAGFEISDDGNVLDAIDRLTDEQAETISGFLYEGPVPMGGKTDVPADADAFTHPVPDGPTTGDVFHHENGDTR